MVLSAFIFFLHPLTVPLFLTIAMGCGYISYKRTEVRKAMLLAATFFIGVAVCKGVLSFYTLTPYESSFSEAQEMSEYLFATNIENVLFLIISLFVGSICLEKQRFYKNFLCYRYIIPTVISILGELLLVSQYFYRTDAFPLKTGLALFAAIAIISMAYIDGYSYTSS